jgi:hypothetical protein
MPWSKLIDMSMDDEDIMDAPMPLAMSERQTYPYGLRISLTHNELEKLGLAADCDVGDMIDMRCFGTVTSVSLNDDGGGKSCRVEIQIEKMAVESEMDEK